MKGINPENKKEKLRRKNGMKGINPENKKEKLRRKNGMKGINPENNNQMRLFLCTYMQYDAKINGHPQEIMEKLSKENGFKILEAVPQSLLDGWDFWIEFDTYPGNLPNIFRDVPWKSIGSV